MAEATDVTCPGRLGVDPHLSATILCPSTVPHQQSGKKAVSKLRSLRLQAATPSTTFALLGLPEFLSLTSLHIRSGTPPDSFAATIKQLVALVEFSLFTTSGRGLPSVLLSVLAEMSTIRKIFISDGGGMKSEWIDHVSSRDCSIESLHIGAAHDVAGDIFSKIASKLRCLKQLHINRSSLSSDGLQSITSLEHLTALSIGYSRVGAAGFTSLSKLSNLKSLDISGNRELQDNGLRNGVLSLLQLKHLNLSDCSSLSGGALTGISALSQLECLHLSYTNIDDSGIATIVASLHRLQQLYLQSCRKLSDVGVSCVADHCAGVEALDIACSSKITGASLMRIAANMRCLQVLNIFQCVSISDAGLRAIAAMATLKEIKFHKLFATNPSPVLTKEGWDCVAHLVK
jgi:hypothetical protein